MKSITSRFSLAALLCLFVMAMAIGDNKVPQQESSDERYSFFSQMDQASHLLQRKQEKEDREESFSFPNVFDVFRFIF